jgi:hypothetical protein
VELHAAKERIHNARGQYDIPGGNIFAVLAAATNVPDGAGPARLTTAAATTRSIPGGDGSQDPERLLVDLAVGT